MRVLKEDYNLIQTVRELRDRDNTAVEKTKERKSNRQAYTQLMKTLSVDEFKQILVKDADYLFRKKLHFDDIGKDKNVFTYLGTKKDSDKAMLGITKKEFWSCDYEEFKDSVVQGKININNLIQIMKQDPERFEKLQDNTIVHNIVYGGE